MYFAYLNCNDNFIFEGNFFIEELSSDRTEILALSNEVSLQDLIKFTSEIKRKLESLSYFQDFRLNFGDNRLLIGINIDDNNYLSFGSLPITIAGDDSFNINVNYGTEAELVELIESLVN